MQFTANRAELLVAGRKLARLLPDQSPIADLTGILMEADENDGSLRMLSTNQEVSLQYRFPASVASGGRMVVNGKLLANMMPLLSDDKVMFRKLDRANIVRIENASASFEISCLPGSHYPEPQSAPPSKMVRICGMDALIGQTAFAAMKEAKTSGDMLANAKLEILTSEARMTCMDGTKLAIARHRWEASGENTVQMPAQFLLPIKTLPLIADVCGDQEVEIGQSGKISVMLSGPNYKLHTRIMTGIYPDTNALLSQIKPAYTAIADAVAFWRDLDRVSVLAEPGCFIRLTLREDGISLIFRHDYNSSSSVTDAVVYDATPDSGFYYSVSDLCKTMRYMRGNISLAIDRQGTMLMKTRELCYLLAARRPHKAALEDAGQKTGKKKKTTRRKEAA